MPKDNKPAESSSIDEQMTPLSDRQKLLAGIAADLVAAQLSGVGKLTENLSNEVHDRLFLDALRRAEFLINEASGQSERPVAAYQLFERSNIMVATEIAEVFKAHGWPKMGSAVSVNDALKGIRTELQSKLDTLSAGLVDFEWGNVDFENAVKAMRRHFDAARADGDLAKFESGLNQLVPRWQEDFEVWARCSGHVVDQQSYSDVRMAAKLHGLLRLAFLEDTSGGNKVSKFRPYWIFKYADEEGIASDKLRVPGRNLTGPRVSPPANIFVSILKEIDVDHYTLFESLPDLSGS